MRGDDGVVGGEGVGVGVLRRGDEQGVAVEALEVDEVACERPLAALVEAALDHGAVRLPAAAADLCEQRHDDALDLAEELVVERAVAAVLEAVEPDVVRVGVSVAIVGDLDHGLDDPVEVGLERREVVCRLRPLPDAVGLGEQAREVHLDVVRDVDHLRAVAAQDLDLGLLGLGQDIGHGVEALEHGAGLRVADELLVLLLEDGLGLAAVGHGLRRVDGRAVARDADARVAVRVQVTLEVVEGGDVLLGVADGRGRRLVRHAHGLAPVRRPRAVGPGRVGRLVGGGGLRRRLRDLLAIHLLHGIGRLCRLRGGCGLLRRGCGRLLGLVQVGTALYREVAVADGLALDNRCGILEPVGRVGEDAQERGHCAGGRGFSRLWPALGII